MPEVDTTLTVGLNKMVSDMMSDQIAMEISKEIRNKLFGLQGGLGLSSGNIPEVGNLTSLEPFLRGKMYLPNNFYLGGGVGWRHNFINESYPGQADIDNEVAYHAVLGKQLPNNWIVELLGAISDLDIETGIPRETPIEKHSRADSIGFRVGRRF